MSISNPADFFLNFQQFDDLKMRARAHSDDAAGEVARQFEGLFVQQMLAAMRSASNIDSGQNSSYMDFYQDMYDKQLAQTIARQDRLGVARMILQQISADETGVVDEAGDLNHDPLRLEPANFKSIAGVVFDQREEVEKSPQVANVATVATSPVVISKVLDDDFAETGQIEHAENRWQSPDRFVADIWPQAQAVSRKLGVSAGLLVAQSALETGWGKHILKFADGRSSNNLFGIKAGTGWQGSSVTRNSLEYRQGILHNQLSRFRAYATPQQSLADYADFILSQPRYQQALKQGGDDQAYIREIQKAGYATDPDYADKIIGILNGKLLQRSLATLDPGVIDHA